MVRKNRLSWIVFLACLVWLGSGRPGQAAGLNAFFPERGTGQVALSYAQESYDRFWLGTRLTSVPVVGEVETRSVSLWLRYGLTERLAVVADLGYIDVRSDGTGGFEDQGIQDFTAFGTFRIAQGGSSSLRRTLAGAVGLRTRVGDYTADAPVSLGDGSTDGLFRLVYQLEAGSFYASQQVGLDLRGDDPPNGFPFYTELGYTFGRLTVGVSYILYVADGGTDIGDPGFTFPGNREEYQRIGARLYFRLSDGLAASVGAFETLDGRNSGDASGLYFSLVRRF